MREPQDDWDEDKGEMWLKCSKKWIGWKREDWESEAQKAALSHTHSFFSMDRKVTTFFWFGFG